MTKHERVITMLTDLLDIRKDIEKVDMHLKTCADQYLIAVDTQAKLRERLEQIAKEARDLDEDTH